MADNSKIEWTDATWNPVTGCSVVSLGCKNCFAMRLAGGRLQHHASRAGLTVESKAGPVWNGQVRLNEEWLTQPLGWKRPRMIFVCAHGDLFHENVPDEWIDRVFAVMALCPHHTFQVLTKRSARMQTYICGAKARNADRPWPLPNVWLGVSTEDQRRADERIPDLLATPAAVRFVSAEPLLGPIDLFGPDMDGPLTNGEPTLAQIEADPTGWRVVRYGVSRLDWVIVGGESGPAARAMHPDWARSIRDQCAAAGVAFHFKQWGAWAPSTPEQAEANPRSGWRCLAGHPHVAKASELYPETGAAFIEYMGKARAGRLLDGIEHNGMPEARP